jgi:hypothetical protein
MTDFEREALTLLMEYLESPYVNEEAWLKNWRQRVEKSIRDRVFRVIPRDEK